MPLELPGVADKHSRDYLLPGVEPSRDPRGITSEIRQRDIGNPPRKMLRFPQVREIRRLLSSGMTPLAVAAAYGVNEHAIRNIRARRSFASVEDDGA